jgi:16S rRNA (guanine527-N7)-methyltransferase
MDISERFPESLAGLRFFEALVRKWSPKINLVSSSTYLDIWTRHIVDSAQVYDLIPRDSRLLVDLGSGAGFPVVVLAILAKSRGYPLRCLAVEADTRKCAFLRTVKRELELDLSVESTRIEDLRPQFADVVTARGLASVSKLLSFAEPLLGEAGTCLFLKGGNVHNEVSEALESWHFEPKFHPSVTSASGAVLEIGEFKRAGV